MDPLSQLVIAAIFLAAFLYFLYGVIRKGVAAGIRDAHAQSTVEKQEKEHSAE